MTSSSGFSELTSSAEHLYPKKLLGNWSLLAFSFRSAVTTFSNIIMTSSSGFSDVLESGGLLSGFDKDGPFSGFDTGVCIAMSKVSLNLAATSLVLNLAAKVSAVAFSSEKSASVVHSHALSEFGKGFSTISVEIMWLAQSFKTCSRLIKILFLLEFESRSILISPTPLSFHCDAPPSYLNNLQRSQKSTSWPSSPVRHSTLSGSGISGSKYGPSSSPRLGLSGDDGVAGDDDDLDLRDGDPGEIVKLKVNFTGVVEPNGRLLGK